MEGALCTVTASSCGPRRWAGVVGSDHALLPSQQLVWVLSAPTSPPQLRTLRGTISEDALPPGPPRGLSPRKLLEHVAPRLSPTCLRLGSASPKVPRTLLTLDEQVVSGRGAPSPTGVNPACPAPRCLGTDPDPAWDCDPRGAGFSERVSEVTWSLASQGLDQQ